MVSQGAEWDSEQGIWKSSKVAYQEEKIPDPLWLFGYGSLCWKFDEQNYTDFKKSCVKGYIRRFWQNSTDHRGIPGSPGLVCTLISQKEVNELIIKDEFEDLQYTQNGKDIFVWGKSYLIKPEKKSEVLDQLAFREKGGYSQDVVVIDEYSQSKALLFTGNICSPLLQQNLLICFFSKIFTCIILLLQVKKLEMTQINKLKQLLLPQVLQAKIQIIFQNYTNI